MTALSDLLAACDALAADTHYAAKTRALAKALRAWAPGVPVAQPVPTPTPTPTPSPTPSPTTGAPTSDAYWFCDFRSGDYATERAKFGIVENESVSAVKLVPFNDPGYPASRYAARVTVSSSYPSSSATGDATTLWALNYYTAPYFQRGTDLWCRQRELLPSGTNPAYPGSFTPESNLSAGWDILGENHIFDQALHDHGGNATPGVGSTNVSLYRWNGVPCWLFRPANAYWILATDKPQTKANSILNGLGQPSGNVQPLAFDRSVDILWHLHLTDDPATGRAEFYLDGTLTFSDTLATMPRANDGTVPGVGFEGGAYRAGAYRPATDDTLYLQLMALGPTRASVGA